MAKEWQVKLEKRRLNGRIRRIRLKESKQKGDHTENEWIDMLNFFEFMCVRCLGGQDCDIIHKDHIMPIYQGGSHGLDNIQPLCLKCNTSKSSENKDWRYLGAAFLNKVLPERYKQKING